MLHRILCDFFFEMFSIKFGAVAEKVFLDAKWLLIGTY
jgi:hypothetical protein